MACSQQTVIDAESVQFDAAMPVDFSGSWQRNYVRDDEVNYTLNQAYNRLARSMQDRQRVPGGAVESGPSKKDWDSLLALARIAELITRPDVLAISQDEYEVRVDRKDDFSMLCAFFGGIAKATANDYGREICGWDGNNLVSHLVLPGGLQVMHRFTMSADQQQLRVVTTVSSRTSRTPFTLRRFYSRFERSAPRFQCIETLSMKRVCSTAELRL